MAEIKIEKKKTAWLWVTLGLILIAAFIYFMYFNDGIKETEKVPETTDLIGVNENNNIVKAFVDFIETDSMKMSLDHAFTNEALLKLTDATNAMADEVGYEVKADMDKVKEYAEVITKDPFDTSHADDIRRATDILTTVLQNIQKAKYPGLTNEAAELRNASSAINPDVLTLDQKDAVKSFFRNAADLLKKMN
ncbi:MAG: hypothetical protein RDU14_17730 [Melioribacteraceae bacterium]|nr:hypothetical protein [Melioribacteraceae bacterium]